jgi:exopolysaccharide production protein ExoY
VLANICHLSVSLRQPCRFSYFLFRIGPSPKGLHVSARVSQSFAAGKGESVQSGMGSGLLLGRAIDVVLSIAALIFLAPLLLLVALLVYIVDPGPILFGHRRLGKDGRSFRCWKFRSMVVDADARLRALLETDPVARAEWEADHKLRDDPRVTRIGHFLRKSSLDELPQFFNVLVGEMSLVGPRPIVSDEIAKYGRYFASYCRVRPGITGLWQISGRNDVSYRRRVALDVAYVRSKSVALDIGILLLTVPRVVARRGSY